MSTKQTMAWIFGVPITAVFAAGIAWGVTARDVRENNKELAQQRSEIRQLDHRMTVVETMIPEIRNDVKEIKDAVVPKKGNGA